MIVFCGIVCWAVAAEAHTPAEFLEVHDGEPTSRVEHAVDVKSVLDSKRTAAELTGPHHFSHSVGCLGRPSKRTGAYLAWYKISNPTKSARRQVAVLDLVRGIKTEPLTIGAAEYFLSPAQRITTGAPSEVPEGLDHYKAYRIVDAPSQQLEVELTGPSETVKRMLGKPTLLCVPTEEWHHDEYFPATHPSGCFVVYELDSRASSEKFAFIDQFGLNQLSPNSSRWLCVRGVLSDR